MANTSNLGPGSPLTPATGYSTRPRATDYPVGVNISTSSREAWGRTSFATLKAIIDSYDVARFCIGHKIDEIRSMEPLFKPADGVSGDVDSAIDAARAVLRKPDREHSYMQWLAMLLENALRYDATVLHRRRNRLGEVIGLDVVDGSTVFPYVDAFGRRPAPPAPAYWQRVKGLTDQWFTSDDLVYERFRPQVDSPYGLAPIESILITANTDLRFQWHFLQLFTEGTIPAGLMPLPEDMSSPDQVAEWQDYWDAFTQGDQTILHKLIAVPAGTNLIESKPQQFDQTFPEYLMRRTAAAFGVVPQDLGMTMDVNRANGETQTDVQFRVNTLPWVQFVEGIVNDYLQVDLGLPVKFGLDTGRETEDRLNTARVWQLAVANGAASPDEWRAEMFGLPVDNVNPTPRGIISTRTGFIPLAAAYRVAGPIDPETAGPSFDEPLALVPFDGTGGVLPDKLPGGADYKRAPLDPEEAQFPQLEHPVPGTDVEAPPAAVAKAETAGVTSDTGITGVDQVKNDDDDDESDEDLVKSELAAFRKFTATRKRRGTWRDFEFNAVDAATARMLNAGGRALVKSDPKGSWRDTPEVTPQLRYDLQITDHYVPAVQSALQAMVGQVNIGSVVSQLGSALLKSAEVTPEMVAQVMALLPDDLPADQLESVLRNLVADGFLAGLHASEEQLSPHVVSVQPGQDVGVSVDWNSWVPGDPPAAALTADGALGDVLDGLNITVKGISRTVLDQIGNGIADGLLRGLGSDEIGRNITDSVGSASRAELIAHTETARAVSAATMQTYSVNGIKRWDLITSAGACALCLSVAAANPHQVGDGAEPPEHPRCLVGSTRVVMPADVSDGLALLHATSGSRDAGDRGAPSASAVAKAVGNGQWRGLRAVTERNYVGDIVTIVDELGNELSGTPNHPIATLRGWVDLGDIREGDHVISRVLGDGAIGARPDIEHIETAIEEVANALPVVFGPVPVSPEDFHGDVSNGDVYVVRAASELGHMYNPALRKSAAEAQLVVAGVGTSELDSTCSCNSVGGVLRDSANCGVGCMGQSEAFVSGCITHSDVHRVAAASRGNTHEKQVASYDSPADSEGFCESLLGFPGEVAPAKVVSVKLDRNCHTSVYNIDTAYGWFFASGIVTHNCRCSSAPHID